MVQKVKNLKGARSGSACSGVDAGGADEGTSLGVCFRRVGGGAPQLRSLYSSFILRAATGAGEVAGARGGISTQRSCKRSRYREE